MALNQILNVNTLDGLQGLILLLIFASISFINHPIVLIAIIFQVWIAIRVLVEHASIVLKFSALILNIYAKYAVGPALKEPLSKWIRRAGDWYTPGI